jgi:hypothetical protein
MREERRKSKRIKKTLTIQYAVGEKNNLKWEMSLIRDISDTGLSFAADGNFSPDDNINIRLKLPIRPFEWVKIEGIVLESKKLVTRVKFTQLTDEDKELINEYIVWFLLSQPETKLEDGF